MWSKTHDLEHFVTWNTVIWNTLCVVTEKAPSYFRFLTTSLEFTFEQPSYQQKIKDTHSDLRWIWCFTPVFNDGFFVNFRVLNCKLVGFSHEGKEGQSPNCYMLHHNEGICVHQSNLVEPNLLRYADPSSLRIFSFHCCDPTRNSRFFSTERCTGCHRFKLSQFRIQMN